MYLVLENTKQSFQFPSDGILMVGNDSDCDVQINHPKVLGRHFSIDQKSYGCVLKVYNQNVNLNGMAIYEKCMLDTGDLLSVDELGFRLLDDEYIPKNSQLNYTNAPINKPSNSSSVYGVRSYDDKTQGHFFIDNFHHDDGWHVIRNENELHLIDNKNKTLLNGMKIAQALLINGDIISNDHYKYRIELPGTSGFSKYSPSHPRNVLLSEPVKEVEKSGNIKNHTNKHDFMKNNLWWMTLLVGLSVLALVIINNPPA